MPSGCPAQLLSAAPHDGSVILRSSDTHAVSSLLLSTCHAVAGCVWAAERYWAGFAAVEQVGPPHRREPGKQAAAALLLPPREAGRDRTTRATRIELGASIASSVSSHGPAPKVRAGGNS